MWRSVESHRRTALWVVLFSLGRRSEKLPSAAHPTDRIPAERMKHALVLALVVAAALPAVQAEVYRCGNEYTNSIRDAREAQQRGCKLVEGGNVTVIEAPKVRAPAAPVRAPAASPAPRTDDPAQRGRDNEARRILEAELKKAEARQAELLKDYNNGEPEKVGIETRNHQRYLDRVADMKAAIARNDSDIAGIKREIARLPAGQ